PPRRPAGRARGRLAGTGRVPAPAGRAQRVTIELELPDDLARFRLPAGVNKQLQELLDKEAAVAVFGAPPVDGLGSAGGFNIMVEDPRDACAAERPGGATPPRCRAAS